MVLPSKAPGDTAPVILPGDRGNASIRANQNTPLKPQMPPRARMTATPCTGAVSAKARTATPIAPTPARNAHLRR